MGILPVVMASQLGIPNGIPTLDENGILKLSQCPNVDQLNGISKLVADYSNDASADIDAILDGAFIIKASASKNCPLTGNYIIIYQFFYYKVALASARVQVALPYSSSEPGSGMAIRTLSSTGVWSAWEKVYTDQHLPTAAEVGAAPAGFGLGHSVTVDAPIVGDLDSITLTGWYSGAPVLDGIQRGNTPIMHVAFGDGYASQTAYLMDTTSGLGKQLLLYRTQERGVWGDWKKIYTAQQPPTAAEVGAAPSGFGLGEQSKLLSSDDDINNIWKNGWYRWGTSIPANAPNMAPGDGQDSYIVMRVSSYGVTNIVQEFWSANQGMRYQARRVNYGGPWETLEWINPPMKLGVEYRTTEQYNGIPVYCQIINFGMLPNSATTKSIEHGIQNVNQIIFEFASSSNGAALNDETLAGCNFTADTSFIYCKTTKDLSSVSARVRLKYTKTVN